MDHKFKVGDIVRQKRTSNGALPYNGFTHGSNYNLPDSNGVVVYTSNDNKNPYNKQAITIDYNGVISPPVNSNCFELVEQEKPKPWLKITPPQPEKRELQGFNYGVFYWMNFSPDSKFAYVGWGSNRGIGKNQLASAPCTSFTKDELQKFGETLIEISKEMK